MDFEILDLKLRLLSGEQIEVDKGAGFVKPLTIREIISYGYSNYLVKLHFLTLEVKDLINDDSLNDGDIDINTFDILVHYGNDDVKSEIENSLGLFFRTERINIDIENHIIEVGDGDNLRMIDRDNFDKVREVIKWQNCVNKFGENDSNAGEESDAVKKIKARLNKGKEEVSKVKDEGDGDGDMLDIYDIISAVSTKSSSINKLNIFDLTLYQLYEEFKRLELIDQYNIGIKSLLAGAKDVDLKHWSTKIDW